MQGTAYTGRAATTGSSRLSTDGNSFLLSLETGYPIRLPLPGPNFVLEPQGQIIWQHIAFGQASDNAGAVELGSTSTPTGRLGVRGRWTIPAGGALWQPYAGVNIWQDWGGNATTTFPGTDKVPLIEQTTRTEILAGVTTRLGARLKPLWRLNTSLNTNYAPNVLKRRILKTKHKAPLFQRVIGPLLKHPP